MKRHLVLFFLAAGGIAACSDSAGPSSSSGPSAANPSSDAGADGGGDTSFDTGVELKVPVPESGRVYAKLDPPSVVTADDAWDLAFEGFDVFTNSGVSGSGKGGAFGPLDAITFLDENAPQVPFMNADKPGGAFLDWYAYDGGDHVLYSRYHVYGVKDGEQLWKVQILSYYGKRAGETAVLAALYKLRYAPVAGGDAQEIDLDGTAGGTGSPAANPSECIDLGTGARTMLTADEARQSSAWHICVRRDSISVNGEVGGPRGVGAIDLQAASTPTENVSAVMNLTADSEKAAFDATNAASFEGKSFRGDRVISAFSDRWIEGAAPVHNAWLVLDSTGARKSLVGFVSFENPTTSSPGTIVMRIKPVKG